MELELRVISAEKHLLGSNSVKVFRSKPGRIGRSAKCDWCLPDSRRHLSGQHAVISFHDGSFYISDTSTNGTFINHSSQPIPKGIPQRIQPKDHIKLGDFELEASIQLDVHHPLGNPLNLDDEVTIVSGSPAESTHLFEQQRDEKRAARPAAIDNPYMPPEILPSGIDGDQSLRISKMSTNRHSSSARKQTKPTPPGINDTASKVPPVTLPPILTEVVSDPVRRAAAMPAQTGNSEVNAQKLLEAFCRGLGVAPNVFNKINPETVLETAGRSLSGCVDGMVSTMKQRARLKNEFRIDMTYVKSKDNNPLKFSASRQQALRHLFRPEKEAFLLLDESFAECFEDLMAHQVGVMAGTQQALSKIMKKLDPRVLERREAARARGISVMGNKGKYWDAYKKMYLDMASEDDLLKRLSGDAFVRGYENNIRRARKSRNIQTRRSNR